MMRGLLCWLSLSVVTVAACGPTAVIEDEGGGGDDPTPQPDARPGGGGGGGGGNEFADAAPQQPCDRMDILFVVDNSGSMLEEQENLAANFPRFIEVLEGFDWDLDYRVGITTTGRDYTYYMDSPFGTMPSSQSGGDNGALLQRCGMTNRWVESTDPDPSGTFSCAAQVGDEGPAMEMPLAVIHEAFTARLSDGTNNGFLRPDALFGIVILTDEDDCSYEDEVTLGFTDTVCSAQVEPVPGYAAFLDELTGGPGRWAVAVIAGPGPGQCSSDFGSAQEASRLAELVALAGDNGVFGSICDGDLSLALSEALATFDAACQEFPDIDYPRALSGSSQWLCSVLLVKPHVVDVVGER
jgi:hypothetical protein